MGRKDLHVEICVAADLKKSLSEDTLLNDCVVKRMIRIVHDLLRFMKYPPLQSQVKRL